MGKFIHLPKLHIIPSYNLFPKRLILILECLNTASKTHPTATPFHDPDEVMTSDWKEEGVFGGGRSWMEPGRPWIEIKSTLGAPWGPLIEALFLALPGMRWGGAWGLRCQCILLEVLVGWSNSFRIPSPIPFRWLMKKPASPFLMKVLIQLQEYTVWTSKGAERQPK